MRIPYVAPGVFTRLSDAVKDSALQAAKAAKPNWHLIDARGQVVGRLASQIAPLLKGQHKPFYCPNYDCGDYVVMKIKRYYWHTGYPGGLKHRTPQYYMEKDRPEEILRHAVAGMLAKNSMRHRAISKLRLFADEVHIYEKQLRGKESII